MRAPNRAAHSLPNSSLSVISGRIGAETLFAGRLPGRASGGAPLPNGGELNRLRMRARALFFQAGFDQAGYPPSAARANPLHVPVEVR